MNWLILLYFIELGYAPIYQSANTLPDSYEFIQNENVYYINFNVEVLMFNHFFIGGSDKIYFQSNSNSYDFLPVESNFLFKTGLRYEKIELGFRHQCKHPLISKGINWEGTSFGGYEEFYIRISNEF